MKQYPESIVGAFILNKAGKLLLVKSHKWGDRYVIPGGHIELGETMENALKREIKEEIGLSIYDFQFLRFWEFINGEEFYKKKHMIFFNFLVKTNEEKVILNNEAQEYIWIDPEDSLKLPLNSYTQQTIENYIVKSQKKGKPL
ncbi:MAG TPA: NUDIX domain-containing protein [Candidatus Sulfotelmatobacter sp.]|jgi:nucleoside triphosphatase|nr:NUDIX domain-containing protein [Candidatus Sulfotelmatobacter sp.]